MSTHPTSYRPDLPDWGVYLRWPQDGDDWIHPEDRDIVRQLLPSRRVLRRQTWDGTYYHLDYGPHQLRVRPSMWLPVPQVDLQVGQQVEVLSREFQNEPGIYRIAEILYCVATRSLEYFVHSEALRLAKRFVREDLRPLHVEHHLRIGYYQHPLPAADIPDDVDLLDVGDLTD